MRVARLVLLGSLLTAVCVAAPAQASPFVARDGKIHACYKAKGKGKGALRVVPTAKARCPKGWKKAAWYAAGPAGAAGSPGEPGAAGQPGAPGERGAPGKSENVVVNELEDKVTELLGKVQSLEAILSGITNVQLKEAIAAVPVVKSLCSQAKSLNEQSKGLGEALGALNTVLDPLLIAFAPVSIPTALPPFACPAF